MTGGGATQHRLAWVAAPAPAPAPVPKPAGADTVAALPPPTHPTPDAPLQAKCRLVVAAALLAVAVLAIAAAVLAASIFARPASDRLPPPSTRLVPATSGSTDSATSRPPCNQSQLLCGDSGACVAAHARCDKRRDCPRGDDEANCSEPARPLRSAATPTPPTTPPDDHWFCVT